MTVCLVEEFLFFRQYRFHRSKLILHRASMKAYQEFLTGKGLRVRYVESAAAESDCRELVKTLGKAGVVEICAADVADDWLRRRLTAACGRHAIKLTLARTPNFLNSNAEVAAFFDERKTYFQTDFYIWQRKMRGWLVDGAGRPIGGKWSFDQENRKRFPRDARPPELVLPRQDRFVSEAQQYVATHFPEAHGAVDGPLLFGVTFADADDWLDVFIRQRLNGFGEYEDAMVVREPFLYHSVLTPMLNIGLLDPVTIVRRVLDSAAGGGIALNSLEGFLRQVMGWREFIHLVYEREGRFQRTRNFWRFSRKIPVGFWKGETGVGPVDIVIGKVLRYGYCHHIERLMVLGNFMLLCEFDPDEVYRWFMELFVDAYDWVMVPNVYGMTQFADGGVMTTKPYISGSNYLLKMGDFPRGEWQGIWDGLFWRFMHMHRDMFSKNRRLGMLLSTFDRMPEEKRAAHLHIAEEFLQGLDG